MTDPVTHTPNEAPSVACQTARTTATVAGVFSVILLGLLGWNFIGSSVLGPRLENKMARLKTQAKGYWLSSMCLFISGSRVGPLGIGRTL